MGDQRTGAIGAYDEPTAEELALLETAEANSTVPPAADDDTNPVTPEQTAAERGVDTQGNPLTPPAPAAPAPGAAPAGETTPAPGAPAPEGQTDDARFAAFMAQHQGKSPEELARLAFQQTSRANQQAFQARQSRESLDAINARAQAAIERVAAERAKQAEDRAKFNEQLANDPDAATRAIHERLASDQDRQLDEQEFTARREATVSTLQAALPTFDMARTEAFGAEMNYTPQELSRITDPRDLATLHFASLSGNLIRAGVIDVHGNLIAAPAAVAATDPRLGAGGPAPVTTLSSAPARQHNGGDTVETQLQNILAMDDAALDAFEKANPGVLSELLKKAG